MFDLFTENIELPKKVQEAMQMQVEAERKKRAAILESEGLLIYHMKAMKKCTTFTMFIIKFPTVCHSMDNGFIFTK
jgi:hypothetical protein